MIYIHEYYNCLITFTEYKTLSNPALILLLEVESTAFYFPWIGHVWTEKNIYITVHGLSLPLLQNCKWTPYFAFPFHLSPSQPLSTHSVSRMESHFESETGLRLAILPAGGRIVVLRTDCHVGMDCLVSRDYLDRHPGRILLSAQGR